MKSLLMFALLYFERTATQNLRNDSAITKDVLTKRQAPMNDIISLDVDSPSDIHIKIIKENNIKNLQGLHEESNCLLKEHKELGDQEIEPLRTRDTVHSGVNLSKKFGDNVKFNHNDISIDPNYADKRVDNFKLGDESPNHASQKHEGSLYKAFKTPNMNYDSSKKSNNKMNEDFQRSEKYDSFKENGGMMFVAIDDDSPIHVLQNFKDLVDQGLKPIKIGCNVQSSFVDLNGKQVYNDQIHHVDRGIGFEVNHDQINKINDGENGRFSQIKDQVNLLKDRGQSSGRNLKNMNNVTIESNNMNSGHGMIRENQRNKESRNDLNGIKLSKNLDSNFDDIRNSHFQGKDDNIDEIVGNFDNTINGNKNNRGKNVNIGNFNNIINGNGNNRGNNDKIDGIVGKNMDESSFIRGSEDNLNHGTSKGLTNYDNSKDHTENMLYFVGPTIDAYFRDVPFKLETSYNDSRNVNSSIDYGDYGDNSDEFNVHFGDNENHTSIAIENNYGRDFNEEGVDDYQTNYEHRKSDHSRENHQNDQENHKNGYDELNGGNYYKYRNKPKKQGNFDSHDISSNDGDNDDLFKGDKFDRKYHDRFKDPSNQSIKLSNKNHENFETSPSFHGSEFFEKNYKNNTINYLEREITTENLNNEKNLRAGKFGDKINYENFANEFSNQTNKFDKENQNENQEEVEEVEDDKDYKKFHGYFKNRQKHPFGKELIENKDEFTKFDEKNQDKNQKESHGRDGFEDNKDYTKLHDYLKNRQRNPFGKKIIENKDEFTKFDEKNQDKEQKEIHEGDGFEDYKDFTKLQDYVRNRQRNSFGRKMIENKDEFKNKNREESFNRHQILIDAIRNRFRSSTGGYEEKTEKTPSENEENVEFSPIKSSKPICEDVAPQAECIKEEDKYFCKIGKSSYTIYTGSNSRVSLQVIEDYVRSMFMKYGEGDRCLDMSSEPGKHGPCLKSKMPVEVDQMMLDSNDQGLTKSPPVPKRGSLNIICTPLQSPPKGVDCRSDDETARNVIYACRWRTPNKIIEC